MPKSEMEQLFTETFGHWRCTWWNCNCGCGVSLALLLVDDVVVVMSNGRREDGTVLLPPIGLETREEIDAYLARKGEWPRIAPTHLIPWDVEFAAALRKVRAP